MPRFLLAVFAALAALHAATAAAQAYRWVDKDGRVHYSDNPPPGATATNVPNSVGAAVSASTTISAWSLGRSDPVCFGSPATAGVAETMQVAERLTNADRAVAPPADGRSEGCTAT